MTTGRINQVVTRPAQARAAFNTALVRPVLRSGAQEGLNSLRRTARAFQGSHRREAPSRTFVRRGSKRHPPRSPRGGEEPITFRPAHTCAFVTPKRFQTVTSTTSLERADLAAPAHFRTDPAAHPTPYTARARWRGGYQSQR